VHDERGLAAYDSFDAARGRPPEWSVAAAMMPVPGCSLWLGWEGEEPVARAMAVATGPVGMIHNVVVEERFRRRGYGRAITTVAALACTESGATSVCLGASRMGYPLYLGMGFEHRYDLATMIRVPTADGAPRHTGDAGTVSHR
jgi:GNAT superfamily N-acetyltransferase